MSEPILLRSDAGDVATLTLNAPGSLNALSDAMLAELKAAFEGLAQDRSARVVILRGAGKAFCAGHDLREMQAGRQAPDGGAAYFAGLFARCAEVMQMIPRLPQPVIAQVHGIATAAGCQLVASCDMAVAAEGTRFGVNGVNIGLFCSTPMVALSRNVPRKQAFEMLTTRWRLKRKGWPPSSRASWGRRCASASRPSTTRSRCRWPKPMITPAG